jgi:hypothetical protein
VATTAAAITAATATTTNKPIRAPGSTGYPGYPARLVLRGMAEPLQDPLQLRPLPIRQLKSAFNRQQAASPVPDVQHAQCRLLRRPIQMLQFSLDNV